MRAEDFLSGASSKAPMSAEDFLGPSEDQNATPKATDYLKGIASGVGGLASGVGYLAEAAGADKVGAAIRGVGDTTQKYWQDAMTPAGKRAAESQVFEDDPNSALPKLGDRWGQALGMGVAQSAPSMLAAAIPGGIAATGLRGIAGLAASRGIGGALAPLAAGTAAPIGGWGANLAGQVAARVPTALGFGAAEGATAGAMNAAQWKSDIEQRPEESLSALPGYASLAAQIGPAAARKQIAEEGAADIMRNTTLSTGFIGALTGGGALGSAFQRATTGSKGGLLGAIGRDAGKEAFQEAPQSAGERLIQNVATRDYLDPNQPASQGVLADALSGAAIGGVMGGVTGGGSYAISGPLSKAVAAAPGAAVPPAGPAGILTGTPAGNMPVTGTPAGTPAGNLGIASAAQFPQFTAPPQPVTGGAPLEQAPTAMPVPQATQNAPAAPGSPSPVSAADTPLPAKQAEAAGAPIQPPQGPLPSADQAEIAIPPAQGPEAAALPVAAKPANGIAAALQYPQQVTEGGGPLAQRAADMRPGSWVIKNKTTGEVILETFDKKKVDALNTNKYEAVPILEYLQGINRSIKNGTLPIQSNGNSPKTADLSPRKAARIASSSGIAGALVTPQQPTFGGVPLEQSPVAMPLGEFGKRAAVASRQTPPAEPKSSEWVGASVVFTSPSGRAKRGSVIRVTNGKAVVVSPVGQNYVDLADLKRSKAESTPLKGFPASDNSPGNVKSLDYARQELEQGSPHWYVANALADDVLGDNSKLTSAAFSYVRDADSKNLWKLIDSVAKQLGEGASNNGNVRRAAADFVARQTPTDAPQQPLSGAGERQAAPPYKKATARSASHYRVRLKTPLGNFDVFVEKNKDSSIDDYKRDAKNAFAADSNMANLSGIAQISFDGNPEPVSDVSEMATVAKNAKWARIAKVEKAASQPQAVRKTKQGNFVVGDKVTDIYLNEDGRIIAIDENGVATIANDNGTDAKSDGSNLTEYVLLETSEGPLQPTANVPPNVSADISKPAAKPRKSPDNSISADRDSLLVAIAKLGGMSTGELTSNGFDQKDITRPSASRISRRTGKTSHGGRKPISFGLNMPLHRKIGGLSFDGVLEALKQYGYFPEGASVNDVIDAVRGELGGRTYYTPEAIDRQATMDADERNAELAAQQDLIDAELAAEREIADSIELDAESEAAQDAIELFADDFDIDAPSANSDERAFLISMGMTEEEADAELNESRQAQPAGAGEVQAPVDEAPAAGPGEGGGKGVHGGKAESKGDSRPGLALQGQTPEEIKAAGIAAEKAAHDELIAKAAEARKEKAAKDKAEKDRRAAEVLKEREAAKKAEVDKAAEEFALGQAAPEPVVKKVTTEEAKGQKDIFAEPAPAAKPEPKIVEHVTAKGKTLRGTIRKDLTLDQAIELDRFTFKKDGGYFIRVEPVPGQPAAEIAAIFEKPNKSAEQAAKLRAAGEKVVADAEQATGRDRLTNTAKRAREASIAEAQAAQHKVIGETMIRIADAIEDGTATALYGITARTQIELLDLIMANAIYKTDDKKGGYALTQKNKGRPFSEDDLAAVKMPGTAEWRDGAKASLTNAIAGKRGAPALRDEIIRSRAYSPELHGKVKAIIGDDEIKSAVGWFAVEDITRAARLARAGITNTDQLRSAITEYSKIRAAKAETNKAKALERALVGQKVGIDFFPTPKVVAADMVRKADIRPGMRVLEPSAGNGNIAEAIQAAGVKPDVIEVSLSLREILDAKGFNIVGQDFMEATGKYDRIVMNPPFSNRMDAEHVQKAYSMLNHGGKIVAIMGEGVFFGTDRKAAEFRDWLDSVGGTSDKLPAGTFSDRTLMATTGTNARLVEIEKPSDLQDSVRFSQESPQDNQPAFYSQLSGAIASARVTSQPAAQWKAWINGNAGNLGIKKDEIEWSGVLDYLDVRGKDKVTKAEIADYLNGNGVRVEDVVKADPYVDYLGDNLALRRGDQTKFSDYWQDSYKGGIPGTYREILVTLPAKREASKFDIKAADLQRRLDAGEFSDPVMRAGVESLIRGEETNAAAIAESRLFRSNHWDEPNVLVHIRTDEVIGADGKRYLRVGEIQSDWGQKGKKDGFKGRSAAEIEADLIKIPDGDPAARPLLDELKAARDGVPQAPFVTDTRAWAALGIKRAIIHAINSGVDGVVFGTGEQNANLYNLSKRVNEVSWRTRKGNKNATIELKNGDQLTFHLDKSGKVISVEGTGENQYNGKRFDEVIGKDVADKVMSDEDGVMSGEGLNIGGLGMRAFYDQIIPSVANDVLKKVGGGKVAAIRIDGTDYGKTGSTEEKAKYAALVAQPGFTITPQMRAKIQSQGVPLFSFAGQQSTTADQFQLDRAKQLLADGANANSVRQQTGWFKGVDGKWRYEIDDSGASLQNMRMEDGLAMRATSLETILDHPALFAAYPALRDMDVQITIDPDGQEGGSFERGSAGDSKTFGRQPEIKVNARTEEKALSTLLHEIQHGIQNVEGFASGGSPSQFGPAQQVFESQSAADEYVRKLPNPFDARIVKDFRTGKIKVVVQGQTDPYQQYKKLAGEVESRNVQQRQNFTADKRKYSDPLGTQDVAPEDVIVMFNGKEAKDAPAPFNTTRASAMAAVGASPADAAVFDMAAEGRSAQEILSFLSKASRRPFNRILAGALMRIGVSSTVSVDPAAGWRNNQNRQGAKFAASYSPKTDTVSLYTPREAERHALHEFVHSATLKAIARGGPAARQMQSIFDYVQRTGTMSDQYGMGNFSRFPNETDAQFKKRMLDEFTAELFTNPQFQLRLKQLPAPSGSKLKSAWDWIVRVIANLLGLKTKAQETALDRALSVGAALLQENAALTMPKGETARYHTTWHGSPHKFYTFDLSKIGTGEGAQAYGHGLYVAEAPEVAKDYQKNLSQFSRIYGNPIVGNKNISSGARAYLLAENADLQKAIQNARDAIVRRPDNELLPPILKELESLNPEAISKSSAGNFYKVDLPAEAVARMLDWDAGLHDNPMAVKIALEKDGWDTSAPDFDMDIDVMTGEDVIRELFDQLGSKQAVSDRLLSMGIVGTRYLDKDSRDKGKGTSNFVLFDDKLARIIEVNGVETGVQPWQPGEWEATQGGERFSQEQPFSGMEVAGFSSFEAIASKDGTINFYGTAKVSGQTYFAKIKLHPNGDGTFKTGLTDSSFETHTGKPVKGSANIKLEQLLDVAKESALSWANEYHREKITNETGSEKKAPDRQATTRGKATVPLVVGSGYSSEKTGGSDSSLLEVSATESSEAITKKPAQNPVLRNTSNVHGQVVGPFSGREVAATPLKPGTKTLMVDGVERPALNSNGNPIHWSEEGVRNFWKWFKNSAVTDDHGRPLVLFHGTNADFSSIDAESSREDGLFFASPDKRVSVDFAMYRTTWGGANVMPAYVSAGKVLVVQGNGSPIRLVEDTAKIEGMKYGETVRGFASRNGYDAILFKDVRDGSGPDIPPVADVYAMFPSVQVKSATGNTGAFSEDPDIRYSLDTNWQQLPVAPGNLYQAAKKKAASLLTPERLDKVIYEMQDKFIDLRRIRDHIKEIGGTITDLNDAHLGEELYHKRLAYRTEQFLKEELRPFFADMKARGVEMPEFEKFMHARHAPEANAEMAKRNPNQNQIDAGRQKSAATVRGLELNLQTAKARGLATVAIEQSLNDARAELAKWNGAQAFKGTEAERLSLSGMKTKDANDLIDSLTPERLADMNALAAKADAIKEGTLQTLERYGLMDKAALNAWRNTYKYYVPLHRDEAHPDSASHPIGQGFNVRGDASKRRTGSNQEVTNIFSHIAMQREAALTRGEKNRVMQKLYLMARQNPIADIWSVGKVPMIDTIDKATGFVRSVPDPQYKDKPNVITLRVAGKDVAIVMNEYNPQALRLAQSIKNLDVDDLHYLIPIVGKATRWFASINTQYNPIFGLINFARDVQTAALNLSTTAIAGKQKEVFKDTMSILGDIIKNKGRMPTAGKWAPIYKEFNEVGGTTGYRDLFLTAEDRSKAVTDEIKALDRGKISQAAHAVAGWLSDYNEAMENATRLAAYKAAIDNGMSKERAASLAKNLTVNFNRKGRQTRELGALYAFFNAAVQGTARMAQTLSGPAGKKIMLGGVLAGAASAMAGIAAMGGGDGEDDEWSKIPEFVKERSLIIPSPFSKEGYFTIPMPLGFHFLPNIGRLMVEMAVYKDKTLGKQMASLFTVLADAFNPLGGSAPPMQIIAPTVMDPFIALAQNKDWTGKPIYVENFNSLNPQPGATRAKDSATPIAKGLADAINAVTGGTKYVPGGWSPTPDQIDYVIGQLTGGVGREIGKLSSTIAAPFTGDELPAHKIPLLGRLYGSTAGATGQAGKFYENIKRANEVENELKGRRKDGIGVDDYLRENPKAVELAARGNAAERQIRALRQMRSRIVEAGGTDAASKARQINERMATVMRGFNMQVERMQ